MAAIAEPLKVLEGTAGEAISGFLANLNVAVALGLAGSGVDNTHLEIWADPTFVRNTHTIKVKSDSADLTMKISILAFWVGLPGSIKWSCTALSSAQLSSARPRSSSPLSTVRTSGYPP
ncbi:MAG: DUF108 domain-containing protein [Magnetovibrio sp.]|nr:DUF108 domain-containing protein [Magnetovibrio sp.]